MTEKLEKSEQEWREELSPDRFHILREKGTEPPFTGAYTYSKADGIYRCGACGNELFRSDAKFDSGTGWPSFTEPAIADAVELHEDKSLGMVRTEVTCSRTDPDRGDSATASTRCRSNWTRTSAGEGTFSSGPGRRPGAA